MNRHGVTPDLLAAGRAALRPADRGVASSTHERFTVRRGGLSNAEFADFTVQTRRAMAKLDTKYTANRMFTETNATLRASHGWVDIQRSANVNDAEAQVANRHNPNLGMYRQANGQRGAGGIGTTVNWNPDNLVVGAERRPNFIGLGHELVHAWRNAHGATMFRRSALDEFNALPAQRPAMRQARIVATGTDEGETVGLMRRPGEWMPSENHIRQEHFLLRRLDYGDYFQGGVRQF
ncbi:M91 family zinc metallopeptidase [Chitinimonas prasina]|nr:M91 family zinc metallopeptidase [Chitinimonas prasina]